MAYRSAIFNPSPYSYGAVDPVTAIFQATAAGFSLTETAIESVEAAKARRFAAPCQIASGEKRKYDACKKANKKRGKPVYPGNPGKWGDLSSDCRDKYKRWQKFKGQCQGAIKDAERLASMGQELPATYEADQNALVTQQDDVTEPDNTMLYAGLGVAALLAVGGGAFYYKTQQDKKKKKGSTS